jgi:phosphopantothenoylcysteine decarboxylase/phosphopantothenate--cysteine ligase
MPHDERLKGRELLIGVTGGIAAYKAAEIVSRCVQAGAGVTVVMTEAACRFVQPLTFEALSGRPACVDMWTRTENTQGEHIALADRAELFCIAPATANVIAKIAAGIADDLLTTTVLSFAGPLLMAPAMNSGMWEKAVVQRNIAKLRELGIHLIGPEEGWLACRTVGAGRMSEAAAIRDRIIQLLPARD